MLRYWRVVHAVQQPCPGALGPGPMCGDLGGPQSAFLTAFTGFVSLLPRARHNDVHGCRPAAAPPCPPPGAPLRLPLGVQAGDVRAGSGESGETGCRGEKASPIAHASFWICIKGDPRQKTFREEWNELGKLRRGFPSAGQIVVVACQHGKLSPGTPPRRKPTSSTAACSGSSGTKAVPGSKECLERWGPPRHARREAVASKRAQLERSEFYRGLSAVRALRQ
jgi:hypothetical protein